MYPLLLKGIPEKTVWGGDKLSSFFTDEEYADASIIYLLSGIEGFEPEVKNGEYKDLNVNDVLYKLGKRFGGAKYSNTRPFPLTVKLIDAKDSLPLGVSTRERFIYVADAEISSQIIFGFKDEISEAELKQRISSNTLFSACNIISLKKGDMINIPAGTLHAVGKGTVFYEISFTDEEFFPVSDYGRIDFDGLRLPLKIPQALEIIDLSKAANIAARLDDTFLYPFGTLSEFPESEGVSSAIIRLAGSVGIKESESFVSVIITDGTVALSYPSGTINLKKGDSILIPQNVNAKFTGFCDMLCTHI